MGVRAWRADVDESWRVKAAVGFRPVGNGIRGGIVGGLRLQAAVLSVAGGSDGSTLLALRLSFWSRFEFR